MTVPDSVLACFASRKFRIKPMGKRGSAVTCGSPPRRRPYSVDAAFTSSQRIAAQVDHENRSAAGTPARRPRDVGRTHWNPAFTAPERTGSGVSVRYYAPRNALDPGFHGAPAGPAYPERAADGAGVTGVRYGARAADRATSEPPARWCLCVPRCPCALWCASESSARSALRSCRPTVSSDRAARTCRPDHPPVPVSCRRGSAGC
jgi:hypothetical protein